MKTLIACISCLLLIGCVSSISNIRQNDPSFTFTSMKPAKEVAKCIEYRGRAESGDFWRGHRIFAMEEYPDQIYRVVLSDPIFGSGVGDILIKPSGNGSSIEYRRGHPWYGEAKFLEIMRQCL